MKVATGMYINVYDAFNLCKGGRDIFIVINEGNDDPTPEEVDQIQKIVEQVFSDPNFQTVKEEYREIDKRLDNSGLNCIQCGFQLL